MTITPELLAAIIPVATAIGGAAGKAFAGRNNKAQQARIEELEAEAIEREKRHKRREDDLQAINRQLETELEECQRRRHERDAVCRDCAHMHECAWRRQLEETGRDITGKIPARMVRAIRAEFQGGNDDDESSA